MSIVVDYDGLGIASAAQQVTPALFGMVLLDHVDSKIPPSHAPQNQAIYADDADAA